MFSTPKPTAKSQKFKNQRRMLVVRRTLLVLTAIFNPTFLVHGFITEENNFVVLKTKDAGTLVGVKEEFPLGEVLKGSGSNSSLPRVYYAFRGIPYAKPPIGPLRWKEPEPPDLTAGPKDATKFKPNCPQWDSVKAEAKGNVDCLYLNIFTPRLNFDTGSRGQGDKQLSPYEEDPRHSVRWLPVLMYVHDGDFISGSGDIHNYEQFLDENTLLVTFNYRLGVFGFLSSPDSPSLFGNYGILDQVLGLKWIRKNIHRFGGDPKRVTIFGDVSSLLLSPLASSADLYQGVILMETTTSIFTQGLISSKPEEFYNKLLPSMDCPVGGTQEEVLDCLQIKTVEDLIHAQQGILESSIFPGMIGPVVNNGSEVFPTDPEEIIRSEAFLQRKVPILVGVDGAEGFRPFYKFYKSRTQRLPSDEQQLRRILQTTLSPIFPTISNGAVDDIWGFYFPNFNENGTLQEGNGDYFTEQMLKLLGDLTVYTTNSELLQILSKRDAVTFNYVFEHNLDKVGSYLKSEAGTPGIGESGGFPWEEKYFLFNKHVRQEGQNEDASHLHDQFMGKMLVKVWTSFAAYSTPKNALAKEKSWGKWVPVRVSSPNDYFHLIRNGSMMKTDFRRQEADFWKTTFSKVYAPDVDMDMDNVVGEGKSITLVPENRDTKTSTLKTSGESRSPAKEKALLLTLMMTLSVAIVSDWRTGGH